MRHPSKEKNTNEELRASSVSNTGIPHCPAQKDTHALSAHILLTVVRLWQCCRLSKEAAWMCMSHVLGMHDVDYLDHEYKGAGILHSFSSPLVMLGMLATCAGK